MSARGTTFAPMISFSGARGKIMNSSKTVNFVGVPGQSAERTEAASETGPRPRREGGGDRLPLEWKIEQTCPVHEGGEIEAATSVDPACIMLFQPTRSQHCVRRLPPVNAHADQCRPDYFILGARKGGTTSLYAYITSHPQVYLKPLDEDQPEEQLGENFKPLGSEEFNDKYVGALPRQYVLDASVGRLAGGAVGISAYCGGHCNNAGHLARPFTRGLTPGTEPRLIVLLREPIKKCYSQLSMQTRLGFRSDATSFDRSVSSEVNRFLKLTHNYEPGELVATPSLYKRVLLSFPATSRRNCLFESAYAMHLAAYSRFFRRESFRIYYSDDFFDPTLTSSIVVDCFNFLGLTPLKKADIDSLLKIKYNVAPLKGAAMRFSAPVVKSLQRTMSPWNLVLKKLLGAPLPVSWQYSLSAAAARPRLGPSPGTVAGKSEKSRGS